MNNKTVLITGASSGIGRATAIYFHEQGWNVIATMRAPENEQALSALDRVLVTKLDVTAPDTIGAAIEKGLQTFGNIDVVVNNAGYGAYGPLEAFARENIVRQFDTNVVGLLEVSRQIIPHFRANHSGVLINISSVAGKLTFPFGALYHGTKFAVEGITESLAFEFEAIGCQAKIVEPGTIATDFAGRSFDFQNNPELTEYQPMVSALMATMEQVVSDRERAAPPSVVAEVIYRAATDGTSQLRYLAGYDAEAFMALRNDTDDSAYRQTVKTMMGV